MMIMSLIYTCISKPEKPQATGQIPSSRLRGMNKCIHIEVKCQFGGSQISDFQGFLSVLIFALTRLVFQESNVLKTKR
jgi:hypothetical protein